MRRVRMNGIWGVLMAAGIIVVLCALWWPIVKSVLGLCIAAATMAFLLLPGVNALERYMSRSAAIAIAMLASVFALVSIVALMAPMFTAQLDRLYASLPILIARINAWLGNASQSLSGRGIDVELSLPARIGDMVARFAGESAGRDMLGRAINAAGGMISFIGQGSIALILTYYFIKDKERLLLQLELCIPRQQRAVALRMARAARTELSAYVRGQLLISGIVGLLTAIGLALAGVPAFLVLGLICAILNLVPYIGGVLGAIPVLLMSLELGTARIIIVIALIIVIQQLQGMVIGPRIMSMTNRLHPVLVMLCLFAGGAIGGIAGMVFAIPIVLMARAILKEYLRGVVTFSFSEEKVTKKKTLL